MKKLFKRFILAFTLLLSYQAIEAGWRDWFSWSSWKNWASQIWANWWKQPGIQKSTETAAAKEFQKQLAATAAGQEAPTPVIDQAKVKATIRNAIVQFIEKAKPFYKAIEELHLNVLYMTNQQLDENFQGLLTKYKEVIQDIDKAGEYGVPQSIATQMKQLKDKELERKIIDTFKFLSSPLLWSSLESAQTLADTTFSYDAVLAPFTSYLHNRYPSRKDRPGEFDAYIATITPGQTKFPEPAMILNTLRKYKIALAHTAMLNHRILSPDNKKIGSILEGL